MSSITSISTIMATAQIINCLVCMEHVRPRQQGVQCDGCFRWSHRIYNTGKFTKKFSISIRWTLFHSNVYFWIDLIGISQEVYRAAVWDGTDIEWRCILCEHPETKSTMEPMEIVSQPDMSHA